MENSSARVFKPSQEQIVCPYCNKFETSVDEACISQDMLDHIKNEHLEVWMYMQKYLAEFEKIK